MEEKDAVDAGKASDDEDQSDAVGHGGFPHMRSKPGAGIQTSGEFESYKYNMTNKKRGVAVIFNIRHFDDEDIDDRNITDEQDADYLSMRNLLLTMKFEIKETKPNMSMKQIKATMSEVSHEDHSQSDCFICVVLSYGEEGYIRAKDGKVSINELMGPIKGANCPSLAGKPKLFFIQAGEPEEEIGGLEAEADGAEAEDSMQEERRIPNEADILLAYSSAPRYIKESGSGSFFIQAVYEVFSKNFETMDLNTMMTRINRKVTNHLEGLKSKKLAGFEFFHANRIPCITSTLTKELHFDI